MPDQGNLPMGVQFDASYARVQTAGGHIGAFKNNVGTINYNTTGPAEHSRSPPAPRCPPASPNFVGRTRELEIMWKFFFGPGVLLDERRIYVLVGIGGCGKTQLSRKFMKRVYDRFKKKKKTPLVFYVDATSTATLETSFASIARANRLREDSSEAALLWISDLDQEFFMYIDNADDSAMNLRQYFSRSENARVLITTRSQKAKQYGTGRGSHCNLGPLSRDEAVELLSQTAQLSDETVESERDLLLTLCTV